MGSRDVRHPLGEHLLRTGGVVGKETAETQGEADRRVRLIRAVRGAAVAAALPAEARLFPGALLSRRRFAFIITVGLEDSACVRDECVFWQPV
jgi:hypothetical protein